MNHLVVGCACPFVIGVIAYVILRFRATLKLLILTPLGMVLCATWAVLPDLPRTFGMAEFDQRISMNPVIDVFFWHYTLNLHESYSPWLNVAFVGMVACLLAAAWRELRLAERT